MISMIHEFQEETSVDAQSPTDGQSLQEPDQLAEEEVRYQMVENGLNLHLEGNAWRRSKSNGPGDVRGTRAFFWYGGKIILDNVFIGLLIESLSSDGGARCDCTRFRKCVKEKTSLKTYFQDALKTFFVWSTVFLCQLKRTLYVEFDWKYISFNTLYGHCNAVHQSIGDK